MSKMRMIIQSSLPTYNKVRRSRDSQYELISKHAGYEYDEHYDWTPFDTKGRSGSNLTWYIEIVEGPQTATSNYGIAVFDAGVAPTSSLPISTSTITSTLLNTLGQVIATSPGHSASATQSRPTSQASATTQPALHNSASSLGTGSMAAISLSGIFVLSVLAFLVSRCMRRRRQRPGKSLPEEVESQQDTMKEHSISSMITPSSESQRNTAHFSEPYPSSLAHAVEAHDGNSAANSSSPVHELPAH